MTAWRISKRAAIRGWRALLHKTPEETIPALRQLGLPVDL